MSVRFYDRTADELAGIDYYEDLVSYPEAATLAGVDETTVRQWKSRHHLEPVGKDGDGRLRFRPIDVLRAEADAARTPGGRPRKSAASCTPGD